MFKKLMEKRNALLDELDKLTKAAETETRAFTAEEEVDFNAKKAEIEAIDRTVAATTDARALDNGTRRSASGEDDDKAVEDRETRAFADYLHGKLNALETRADVNFSESGNTALIPSTIANKIITRVVDISPIFAAANRYNVKGTLQIPYYDESTTSITMAYATEFSDLESTAGGFASISLTGFLAGVLSKISKSLINNAQFDVVSVVIERMAVSIAKWIDTELLNGTNNKIAGLSGVTAGMTKTAASQSVVTADELIDVQELIPDVHQGNAMWIMGRALRAAIRKLKDGDGNYLLNKDATSRWGYTLFGKDVYVSDQMPAIVSGGTALYYGDMSGLAVKVSEDITMEVLREKYATQHVVGVVGWLEMDAKIEDAQKIAKLKFASAT